MLGDNIKIIRKSKGLTQEELATKLHIVRQTVSKWEKNFSVPDADLLEKIAIALDTDVQTLLGTQCSDTRAGEDTNNQIDNSDIALQLSKLNEQLASKNRLTRRVWKIVAISLISIAVLLLLWYIFGKTIEINESSSEVFTKVVS